ncbi:hypothetical protein GGI02_000131 [Coemansia sp. RSA 2322]|nr:hypothetical protein GGI02_000131 [Coemansia sp. RSA 2322]
MVLNSYESGTLCWAKLKGYPCAWITPENLEPYEENLAKYGSKAKNRKDPSFSDALKQAQAPSIAEALIKRRAGDALASADNSNTGEDEDDSDKAASDSDGKSDVEMRAAESDSRKSAKPKPASRRSANGSGRARQPRTSNKRASLSAASSDDDDDDAAVAATPKRSRTAAAREGREQNTASPSASTRRDSDDSRSMTKDSPRSVTPENKWSSGAGRDEAKSERSVSRVHQHNKSGSKAYQSLMQLRHRLQKTVIKGPLPIDLVPVHEVFRKLEDFDMTLELIQETKIGKVMRIIASSDRLGDAPEESFDIKGRAIRLADKWRTLIVKRRDGSAEPAAPEEPLSRKSPEPELELKGEERRLANDTESATGEPRDQPDSSLKEASLLTHNGTTAPAAALSEHQQPRAATGIPSS